jgi:serine/threonine protein phosphatase 1
MLKTLIVGDIHGCYSELTELLSKVGITSADRVVSVGDLIVKGPESGRVLEFFQTQANTQAVIGNHERLLLRHFRGEKVLLKAEHVRLIDELGDSLASNMNWISRLPYFIDLGSHLVVHAGVRPGRPIEDQTPEDLTELRAIDGPKPSCRQGTPWFERYEDPKPVIFGHWVFAEPLIRTNAMGIDTGCVYGGHLTAVLLPELRIERVRARTPYARKED